jgi:O-antigen ligase
MPRSVQVEEAARPRQAWSLRGSISVVVVGAFFLLLLAAPLPMGANREWAWAPMTVAVAGIAIVAALGLGPRRGLPIGVGEGWPIAILAAGFVLMIGVALLQMSTLAPQTASASFYAKAAEVLGHAHAPVPSLAVDASFYVLLRCLACGLIFCIARTFCRNERRARFLLMVLLVSAFLVMIYGFLGLSNHSCFLGSYLKKQGSYSPEFDRCIMSGTFVNSNSFGCFVGMAVIAAIALALRERRADARAAQELGEGRHILDRVTGWRLTLLALALFFAGGLLFSGSRAAFAATVASFVLLAVLLLRGRLHSRRQLGGVLIGLGIVGGLFILLAGGALIQKTSSSSSGARVDRGVIWQTTLQAIGESPWLGWGLGSFPDIYAVHQPTQIPLANDKAHSTPLETILELGIPGGAVAMATVLLPWVMAVRAAWRRRHRRYLTAAAFAVSAVPIFHSTVDFSLQMPAIAFFVSALLGMGWAQAFAPVGGSSTSLRSPRDNLLYSHH